MGVHSIIADIERFLAETGMKESTFGRGAVKDWKLIGDIRKGRRLWPDTETRIRSFMDSYARQAPRVAVCQVCSHHLNDVTLRSCTDTGCPYVGGEIEEIDKGGAADRGQGAGSSPLSTSQPAAACAANAAHKPAGTYAPKRKAA